MPVRITDSETSGNGKDGINLGQGVDATIKRSRSNYNKGGGIVAEGGANTPQAKPSWRERVKSDVSVRLTGTVMVGLLVALGGFIWAHYITNLF